MSKPCRIPPAQVSTLLGPPGRLGAASPAYGAAYVSRCTYTDARAADPWIWH